MKNTFLLISLLLLCFTVQPQSINGVANQTVTGSGAPVRCASLPCVVFNGSFLNQTAPVSPTIVYTSTAAGTYELACTDFVQTAGTAGTMQCGWNWKPGGTGATSGATASATTNMTTAGLVTQASTIVHLDGVSGVTYFANYTGATGTPVCNQYITITRLQ
jgi:hypothetical protein